MELAARCGGVATGAAVKPDYPWSHLRVLGDVKLHPFWDNTHHARRMAMENAALCSHRYKTEWDQRTARCDDCGKVLERISQRFRTGKTQRKRTGEPYGSESPS